LAAEAVDVDQHDRELLKKLQEKNKMAQKNKLEEKGADPKEKGQTFVTTKEFLDFQKDVTNRIRTLEDQIHNLRSNK